MHGQGLVPEWLLRRWQGRERDLLGLAFAWGGLGVFFLLFFGVFGTIRGWSLGPNWIVGGGVWILVGLYHALIRRTLKRSAG